MKRGFTLAEVLITLGIIGVVAAITIPVLINQTKDAEYATAYKKAYSIFSNAFANVKHDNGDSVKALCSENTGRTLAGSKCISDAFKSYLKVAKDCETGNSNDCTNFYTNSSNLNGDNTFTTIISSRSATNTTFVLNDGSVVSFDFAGGDNNCNSNPDDTPECFTIIVDTNGNKGPNKLGLDINPINALPDRLVPIAGNCDRSITNDIVNGFGCGALYLNGQNIPPQ